MSEMVERVARALSIADGMHPEATSNDEDETPAWTLYVGMARAAIEAMRLPTKEMIDAAVYGEGPGEPNYYFLDEWKKAIDAALQD